MVGHIFWNTDDITFGFSGDKKNSPKNIPQQNVRTPRVSSGFGQKPIKPIKKPMKEYDFGKALDVAPLGELLLSMKKTFLPSSENDVTRFVFLSSSENTSPMFLLRQGDTTLLFHTGFDSVTTQEKEYMTFPDVRLVFSEKDRINGWILMDEPKYIDPILLILDSLGYPPIYAPRNVINSLRTRILDSAILEKCRFFELFTEEALERKFGSIVLKQGLSSLGCDIETTDGIFHDVLALGNTRNTSSKKNEFFLEKNQQTPHEYILAGTSVKSGNIVIVEQGVCRLHDLSFTLDTFYIDQKSVGIIASYALEDRKMLGKNGVITCVIEEDHMKRAILGHIYIDSRWFVHPHEMMRVHKELIKSIRMTYEKSVLENSRIERSELVQILRREITKHAFLLTGRTPMVMPVVLEQ